MKFCPECGNVLHAKLVDHAQRLVCTQASCHFVHWNNPTPVIAALVEYDGKYIIARNVRWPKHLYSVISGYLEARETPEQAVLREVKEELDLSGNVVRHIGNYAFPEKNQIILCYEVQAMGTLTTNHELAEVKLLLPEELANYDFGPLYITGNILEDWKRINRESAKNTF